MKLASTTSSVSTGTDSRSTVIVPLSATNSIRNESSDLITTDFSDVRKSPAVMCATFVLEFEDQAPMGGGCTLASWLSEAGGRRSELPSGRTGTATLTAAL